MMPTLAGPISKYPERKLGQKPPILAFVASLAVVACGRSQAQPDGGATGGLDGDQSVDGPGSGWDDSPLPSIAVSPSLLDFGIVDLGLPSAAQVVTVAVSGGTVAINPTLVGPGFALTQSTCTDSQPAGSVCALSVTFTPTTIGAASGALTVGSTTVALSGVGNLGPSFSSGDDRIDLGTLRVNQAASVVVPIGPPQPAPLVCTSASSDLTLVSQTCPTTGNIDTPCAFTFTFKAATPGSKSDSVVCTGGGKTTQAMVVLANVVAADPPTIHPSSALFVAIPGKTDVVSFAISNSGSTTLGPLMATISARADVFSIVSNACAPPCIPLVPPRRYLPAGGGFGRQAFNQNGVHFRSK